MITTSTKIRTLMLAVLVLPFLSACAPASALQLPDETETEESAQKEYAPNPDHTLENVVVEATKSSDEDAVLAKYKHLDPSKKVSTTLLRAAVLYFDANPSRFPNRNYLSVVDFSKHSSKDRFFVINLKSGAVQEFHVAHGKNSDKNNDGYADSFSNTNNSNQSSLGVYRASESYQSSKFGYSMRLDGLSSTNSRVRERAIVLHPANYVSESGSTPGRTWGCLGVAPAVSRSIVDMLKGGSLIYVGQSGSK